MQGNWWQEYVLLLVVSSLLFLCPMAIDIYQDLLMLIIFAVLFAHIISLSQTNSKLTCHRSIYNSSKGPTFIFIQDILLLVVWECFCIWNTSSYLSGKYKDWEWKYDDNREIAGKRNACSTLISAFLQSFLEISINLLHINDSNIGDTCGRYEDYHNKRSYIIGITIEIWYDMIDTGITIWLGRI